MAPKRTPSWYETPCLVPVARRLAASPMSLVDFSSRRMTVFMGESFGAATAPRRARCAGCFSEDRAAGGARGLGMTPGSCSEELTPLSDDRDALHARVATRVLSRLVRQADQNLAGRGRQLKDGRAICAKQLAMDIAKQHPAR